MSARERIVVAISGASGAAIGLRIVERLAETDACEIHFIVSAAAERTLAVECGPNALPQLRSMVSHCHAHDDIGACIASGSFETSGMIVSPCSIHTLSSIAWGQLDNLVARAADVQLKERRRLVLMVRETPLHLGHLRTMVQVAEIGATIMPPVPAFYLNPETLAHMIDDIAARAINLIPFKNIRVQAREWQGHPSARA